MSFLAVGFFASVPNLIGMSGNVVGGLLTDRFVRRQARSIAAARLPSPAFLLGALSMTMPFVTNDVLAVVLMGLALFGNQWVAATYIGTVGDVVPQQLAGRVNGIAGFGDNGAALLAVLYTGVIVDIAAGRRSFRSRHAAVPGDGQLFLVLRRIEPAVFRQGVIVRTPNLQLPTPRRSVRELGESRCDSACCCAFLPDVSNQSPWELGVGGWELARH